MHGRCTALRHSPLTPSPAGARSRGRSIDLHESAAAWPSWREGASRIHAPLGWLGLVEGWHGGTPPNRDY